MKRRPGFSHLCPPQTLGEGLSHVRFSFLFCEVNGQKNAVNCWWTRGIPNKRSMLWGATSLATICFVLGTDISTSSKPSLSGIDVFSAEIISVPDQISLMAPSNLRLQLVCPLSLKRLRELTMPQNKPRHGTYGKHNRQETTRVLTIANIKVLESQLGAWVIQQDLAIQSEHHGVFVHINHTAHDITCLPRASVVFIALVPPLGLWGRGGGGEEFRVTVRQMNSSRVISVLG